MLRPLHDRLVVRPSIRQLSDVLVVRNDEPFNEGEIVAIGPRVRDAKPGDQIKYGNGSYLDWPIHEMDGQVYQIIQEADVACIVESS